MQKVSKENDSTWFFFLNRKLLFKSDFFNKIFFKYQISWFIGVNKYIQAKPNIAKNNKEFKSNY